MSQQIHNEDLYTAIQAIRQTQIDEVAKAAEHRGAVTEKLEGLCGPYGRVTKLEQHNNREEWKTWGKHGLTALAAIAGHKVLKLIGWNL